jgi:hypothetical protein
MNSLPPFSDPKTSCGDTCGQTLPYQVLLPLLTQQTLDHKANSLLRASRTTQLVSTCYLVNTYLELTCPIDYPRTLREWGRRLERNMTPEIISKEYPDLADPVNYDIFSKKWQYLFAYAGAGFAKGYITCHMLTFIRQVSLFSTFSTGDRF